MGCRPPFPGSQFFARKEDHLKGRCTAIDVFERQEQALIDRIDRRRNGHGTEAVTRVVLRIACNGMRERSIPLTIRPCGIPKSDD